MPRERVKYEGLEWTVVGEVNGLVKLKRRSKRIQFIFGRLFFLPWPRTVEVRRSLVRNVVPIR